MTNSNKRKLGAWFPSASVIKAQEYGENSRISLLLFYHYVTPQKWSEAKKQSAIAWVEQAGERLNLGGRCRMACEGMNCTISGTAEGTRKFAQELKEFDNNFSAADFKFVDNLPVDRAFKDLKVLPVKELVFYGIENEHTLGEGGVHLAPEEYHQKLSENKDDTVVIDVRNGYEYDIGRFAGQEKGGGAELLNPEMRKSTDFPDWLNRGETREKLEGKQVLMYCTGGVRCERASALLRRELGDKVKGIYQLQGGIEKYLQAYPNGGFWRGKNFVFDKREAFDVTRPEGIGGEGSDSARKKKKQKQEKEGEKEEDAGMAVEVLGNCCVCDKKWDRYLGKRKCKTCEVPVLVCEPCCTKRADKAEDVEGLLRMRCPLCVREGVTVLASQLRMTDNGRRSDTSQVVEGAGKASKTVLRWGGSQGKKGERSKSAKRKEVGVRDLAKIPCKFGDSCTRRLSEGGCWFKHDD